MNDTVAHEPRPLRKSFLASITSSISCSLPWIVVVMGFNQCHKSTILSFKINRIVFISYSYIRGLKGFTTLHCF